LAGLYVNPDNGNVRRLLIRGGKLMYERRPGVETELAPIGEDRFLISGIPIRLEIAFIQAWPDTRLMSISTGEGTPLMLVYIGPDSTVPAQIAEYALTFRSDEADATVTTVGVGGKLWLRTKKSEEPLPPGDSGPGRGWFQLESVSGDAFK